MAALADVESNSNPFAIGVVGGTLVRQPANKAEAVATAEALEREGYNFSIGVAQVNRYNLARHGLDYAQAFEPCANLLAGATILKECFDRAGSRFNQEQTALRAALSCYYSGNFRRGFQADPGGRISYVEKVIQSAAAIEQSAVVHTSREARSTSITYSEPSE
jgi:type IV secretion system protein VirB1